jgi:penicillin-binding protein 1A
MLKANTNYNPRLFPEHSMRRRNVVISQMVKYKFLDDALGSRLMESALDLKYKKITYETGPAPYFREMLRKDIEDWCRRNKKKDGSSYNLYTDGLRIFTTLDHTLQAYAEDAMISHMSSLQKIFDKHWEGREPWGSNYRVVDNAIKRSDRYKNLKDAGYNDQEIRERFEVTRNIHLFDYDGIIQQEMSPLDSVKYYMKLLNTGFLAMDPGNGAVKAWIGGISFSHFKYDHVLSQRQVGSTFKPFVYLSALERGIDPYHYFSNEKTSYADYDNWTPSNSDGIYGGYYSFEGALVHSINTIAVEMIHHAGISDVIKMARSAGITSPLPEVPSLALGAADLTLMEMVTAYCCLANAGNPVTPHYLLQIEDSKGNLLEIFEKPEKGKKVFTESNGRLLIHMLESVVDSGTARNIRTTYGLHGDIAGKTGTTQNNADGWFIGITPELVAGVWVGAEDPAIHFRSTDLGQGAFTALPIWARFMQKVYNDRQFAYIRNGRFSDPSDYMIAMSDLPYYRDSKKEARKAIRATDVSHDKQVSMTTKKSKKPRNKEPFFKRVKKFFKRKG